MKTIRKAQFFLMAILVMWMVSACEENNGGGNGDSSNLIGTWTIQDTEILATIGDKDLTTAFMELLDLTEAQAKVLADLFVDQGGSGGTITFKEEGTYTANFDEETEEGNWTLSSDGKALTLIYMEGTESYTDVLEVVSLTSSEAVFKIEETQTEDLNGDDIDETIKMTITLTLVK